MSVYLDAIKVFLIQDVTRIHINEVSNCEIQCLLIEASEDEIRPLSSVILKETNQNGYSNIRKTLIENKQCSKEAIPNIYQTTKKRPDVEYFEVTPKSSPETVLSYRSATEAEEEGHTHKFSCTFSRKVSCIF